MKRKGLWLLLLAASIGMNAQGREMTDEDGYAGKPLPAPCQVAWQQMETYAFVHFGLNTFTDQEWGYGDVSPERFNPARLDCEQWVRTFVAAGMKGVIITAKHHDGFCLWPSKYTDYSIARSPYKNGKGDILRELSDACHKYGLRFGVYLSPWDRHQSSYGTAEYLTYYRHQLEELLTQYGDIFEMWFDGANGGDGWYGGAKEKRKIDRRTYYDFPTLFALVKKHQPEAIIFSDGGPGCRWVGNEKGFAHETNWAFLRGKEVYPGYPKFQELPSGHEDGDQWTAAECDVSIRPGWFYHEKEDSQVKTPEELEDIYYKSVGRNATMLLNFPVNRDGLVSKTDSANAVRFHQKIERTFAHNLLAKAKASIKKTDSRHVITYSARLAFTFSRIILQEDITQGQRVRSFHVEYWNGGKWMPIPCGEETTTIGYKRILRLRATTAKKLRIVIDNSYGAPQICFVGAY